jgi:UDP-N-acetylmuramyl pentapeptide phosphotransferase/UDP-N-acetylglucosamine-1-phosphate transferase
MIEGLAAGALASALLSFVLVGVVRSVALKHGVIDHPGDRSSHTVATPRGGGLGLLIAALGLWAWHSAGFSSARMVPIMLGAALVALVGWVDDRRGLPVRTRLAVHVSAAALTGWVAASHSGTVLFGAALFLWWTFWTVSSINLVNFMDGINGLVASQVAVFAISLALSSSRPADATPFYAITLAAACIGFLPWNFPRARIFLGDVGSGGLGYLIPALALLAMREHEIGVVRAHLPLLPLFGDAVSTIVLRWRRGERLTQAHRSHLYQRLANGRLGHTAVTAIYAAVSLCGAAAAHLGRSSRTAEWILAYVGLTVVLGLVLDRFAATRARART